MTVFRVGLVALLVVALAEYAPQVRSEEQEQSEGTDDTEDDVYQQPSHLLTDLPEAADDVSTTYVFPDHPNLMITSGESVEVLCGIHNGGDEPLNVTQVAGSLNSPLDPRVYIQNWTSPVYNAMLAPGAQGTFGVTIKPDSRLQPRDFLVQLSIFYESETELFSSPCFNGTVFVLEPAGFLDVETFFMYFFIVSVVGLAAFASFKGLQSAGVVKKKSKSRKIGSVASRPAGNAGIDENEWLKGTAADFHTAPKKRTVRKK